MLLSYWLRLVCLALFSTGLVQVVLMLLLRLLTPALNCAMERRNARWRERICFAVPVVSHLAAFVVTVAVIAPQYIHSESNSLDERVGILCIAGALLVAGRYAYALMLAVELIRRSLPRRNTAIEFLVARIPIQITDADVPLLAVAGLLSPRIVVSRRLLETRMLTNGALEIAIAHECAHLRHFDNLKLFVLASLAVPARASAALRRWRRAAEIAADEEAVAGSRSRAILLAEALIIAARAVPSGRQPALTLALRPHEEELEDRIHRLLDRKMAEAAVSDRFSPVNASLLLLGAAGLLLPLALAFFHEFAEFLLHLG